eukprot:jgi/Chrzof1/13197/Cz07g24030.t1
MWLLVTSRPCVRHISSCFYLPYESQDITPLPLPKSRTSQPVAFSHILRFIFRVYFICPRPRAAVCVGGGIPALTNFSGHTEYRAHSGLWARQFPNMPG